MSDFAALLEGYHRFRVGVYGEQKKRFDQLASEGQDPRTLVIACSDSRVDPVHIFDTHPGEIFVVRNVGALVPPFETTPGLHGVSAALEFAVQVLRVRDIVVMGHGLCGGSKAALTKELEGTEPGRGGFIANWISLLDDARNEVVEKHGTSGHEAERAMEYACVRVSLANLRTFPCVQRKESLGSLHLHGAFFAISEGVLHILDEKNDSFFPVD